jgi:hypothetical protein
LPSSSFGSFHDVGRGRHAAANKVSPLNTGIMISYTRRSRS